MENAKLARTSVVLDRILKILQGFMIAGILISLIFIPLTLIFGEKVIADASTLDLGNLSLKLNGDFREYLDLAATKRFIIVSLLSAAVGCGVGWYCTKVFRSILAPMKEGRPFDAGIADRIRTLGWAVLIGGAVGEVFHAISQVLELKAYDLSFLANDALTASMEYDYSIEPWFIFTALILFFLSYIFRYGEALQRESDETL